MSRAALALLCTLIAPRIHAQSYSVTTLAGTTTIRDNIPASQAFLRTPAAVQVDSAGNIYVLDQADARVRRIDQASGLITTVAGNGLTGFSGDGGPAINASLSATNIAVDRQGLNLYIADSGNYRVRLVDLTSRIITTIAGNGTAAYLGDGGPAVKASLRADLIALDTSGNIYLGDRTTNVIRKVDAATGLISTFAGVPGQYQSFDGSNAGDGGPALKAVFFSLYSLAADGQYLYIGDRAVRRIDLGTNVITAVPPPSGSCNSNGYPCNPMNVSMDDVGNLLVSNYDGYLFYLPAGSSTFKYITVVASLTSTYCAIAGPNNYVVTVPSKSVVRRYTGGTPQTIAGFVPADGQPALSSILNFPTGAAMDSTGDLFIADNGNGRFRMAAAGTGVMSTIYSTASAAPARIAVGTDDVVYGAGDSTLLVLGKGSQTVCPTGVGKSNGINCWLSVFPTSTINGIPYPDGIKSSGLRPDTHGSLYYTELANSSTSGEVHKVDLVKLTDTKIAGTSCNLFSGVCPQVSQPGENLPASASITAVDVTPDAAGNVYYADTNLHSIRRIDAASGLITTAAGGAHGNGGDGGPALKAGFLNPQGVAIDLNGNLLIADPTDLTIRRVDAKTGIITRISGTGDNLHQQDSGAALQTSIGATSIQVLADGSLLVADTINDRIRRLIPQRAAKLSIASGNNQSGAVGATVNVAALVADSAGVPVATVPVTFAVTSGAATLAIPTVTSSGDGTATATVVLGQTAGTVTVSAGSSGIGSVTFTLTAVPPFISSTNGVTGLPMSSPPVTALSVNGLMQISGQGFLAGGGGTAGVVGDGDLVNGGLPTVYKGVCVSLSGTPAPLLAASQTRIIFQVPSLPPGGTADVTVTTACGTGQDLTLPPVTLPVQAETPEFFYTASNPGGASMVAVMNNATGQPAPASQPGDTVTVFLTGLGATDSTNPGDVLSNNVGVNANVTILLGMETIAPTWVTTPASLPGAPYVTSIGENAGVYMIQFTIPADAPPGNLPLVAITDDGSTSPAAYLVIQTPPASVRSNGQPVK